MNSQVRRLVLVESTALFDTSGIDLKPNKAGKVKTKGSLTHASKKNSTVQPCAVNASWRSPFLCLESGLFGVPLTTLLDQDQRRCPGTKVPIILQRVRRRLWPGHF